MTVENLILRSYNSRRHTRIYASRSRRRKNNSNRILVIKSKSNLPIFTVRFLIYEEINKLLKPYISMNINRSGSVLTCSGPQLPQPVGAIRMT